MANEKAREADIILGQGVECQRIISAAPLDKRMMRELRKRDGVFLSFHLPVSPPPCLSTSMSTHLGIGPMNHADQ
jgi:hypothetical protein